MPLPGILMPSSTPVFQLANHNAKWQSPFINFEMSTGHRRKRRVRTIMPHVVTVSALFDRGQMTDFHRWHRDTLRNGERSFSARVKEQGDGLLWYESAWVGMYSAVPMNGGYWRVYGELLLTGEGQVEPPGPASFSSNVSVSLAARGSLFVPVRFGSSVTVALIPSIRFHSSVTIALEQ